MSAHPIYLAKYRLSPSQRAHFAIFIPNLVSSVRDSNDAIDPSAPDQGTLINVVGTPMTGYAHEFKRGHNCTESVDFEKLVRIGIIQPTHFKDDEAVAKAFETIALQLPAPGKNGNFMAPVNDTTNRRCQEWTMDYLRLLVERGLVNAEAVAAVQAERDPASHGIGLRAVGGFVQ